MWLNWKGYTVIGYDLALEWALRFFYCITITSGEGRTIDSLQAPPLARKVAFSAISP